MTEGGSSGVQASPSPGQARELAAPPSYRQRYADEGVNLVEFANILVHRWRILVGLPLLTAVAAGIVSLIIPRTFTATTSFVPEARPETRLPSGLAGLAGQFGISLGSQASQSPRFYAQLAGSRELLERVLLSRYADPRADASARDTTTLLRILGVRGKSIADSLHNGVKKLSKQVSANVDNQTGIVRLSVDSRHPALAAIVANRIVEYLNEFNTKTRQSQARERRKFVEARITDGDHDLRQAEDDLKRFYEKNRSWQQSPGLVFEEGRLRRQVELRQEVYLTLRREYETARIEEVNDTPVITVIDVAVPPQEKSKPKRSLLVLLSFLLAVVASVAWIAGEQYVKEIQQR